MTYRNAPIPLLPRLIYGLLRVIAWLGVNLFYRRTVVNRPGAQFDGPAIVVSNHPNTLMDVLNTGVHIRQEMFFLANYGLFKHPVSNWVFSRLFCIPVKRKEDVAEGESRNNDAAFEQSFRHLEKNGILFIAAEGVSWMNRWVRPFKTGAARIAIGAESRNQWGLGVKIIPVGLSYSAPNLFRSYATVEYGEPIDLRDWQAAAGQDSEQAIDLLTEEIHRRVSAASIDGKSEENELLVNRLETVLRNPEPGTPRLKGAAFHQNFKKILEKHLSDQDTRQKTTEYFENLEKAGLTHESRIYGNPGFLWPSGILLLLSAPLFIPAYLFWFLPCFLPWLLARYLKLYVGYDSTVKMLGGVITFSVALVLAWKTGLRLGHSPAWGWVGLGLAIAGGFFADFWLDLARRWRAGAMNKA